MARVLALARLGLGLGLGLGLALDLVLDLVLGKANRCLLHNLEGTSSGQRRTLQEAEGAGSLTPACFTRHRDTL